MQRVLPTLDRVKKISHLSLPIVFAMLSGNILTLVDTIMVGFLGDKALAAAGLAAMVAMLFQASVTGLSPAVQALCARKIGAKEQAQAALPLNAGLLVGLAVGIFMAVVGVLTSPYLFPFLTPDPEVAAHGLVYLQLLIGSLPLTGLCSGFRGFWNGIGNTRVYFKVILLMLVSNGVLNYLFIFGKLGLPRMGLAGAGLGTILALALGTVAYMFLTWRTGREMGFLKGRPNKAAIQQILKLSLPSSTHDLLFFGGFFVFFWMAGQVGTTTLAATVVLARIKMIAIMPGMGFGIGGATLVGQSIGAGDHQAAFHWVNDVMKVCFLTLFVLSMILIGFDHQILSLFLKDAETLAVSVGPLQLIAIILIIETSSQVYKFALLGAGDNKRVMKVGFFIQWILFLPLAWYLGVTLDYGLMGLWVAESVHGVSMVLCFGYIWHKGKWRKNKV